METLTMELSLFNTGQQFRRTLLAYRNGWQANPGVSQQSTTLSTTAGTQFLVNFVCENYICFTVNNPVTLTLILNSVTSTIIVSDIFMLSYAAGFSVSVQNTSPTNTVSLIAAYV